MSNLAKALLFVFLTSMVPFKGPVMAQDQDRPLTTRSKKAQKAYENALELYAMREYSGARRDLLNALDADPGFIEAYLVLGDVYSALKMPDNAIQSYRSAIAIDPAFFPNAMFLLAELEYNTGSYSDALDHYTAYLEMKGIPKEKKIKTQQRISCCEFAIRAIANPVPFNPVNLSDKVNTADDEYVNAITADDQLVFFTRNLTKAEPSSGRMRREEDFYRSEKKDGTWSLARPLGPPINTDGNEGALYISPDGMNLYFAGCDRTDGLGSCDLYHAVRQGNTWTVPVNMGKPVNSAKWETQPSVTPDGKTLYFTSNRPGSVGGSDIWVSRREQSGRWGLPQNLGEVINTPEDEMNPFIHPDGKTLYFASKGGVGMGGFDLYVARMSDDSTWQTPVNLGYPINGNTDEIALIVNAAGDLAYFSSDKLGGNGKNDIYYFELYKEARPSAVSYIKGKVYDADTREPLQAGFSLVDLQSGETTVVSVSDPVSGEFLVTLPVGKDYALQVKRDGYLFFSDHVALKDQYTAGDPFLKDVPLQPVRAGKIVAMNNIFFETDRSDLKPESHIELNSLLELLRNNPGVKIEIRGHTDNTGSEEHNLALSTARAKVVYDYLVSKGINAERLVYKGFGETSPLAGNDTERGRQLNRRTEFRVL